MGQLCRVEEESKTETIRPKNNQPWNLKPIIPQKHLLYWATLLMTCI